MNRTLVGRRIEVIGCPGNRLVGRRGVVVNAWDSYEYALVAIDGRNSTDAISVEHLRVVELVEGSDAR